MPTTTTKPKRCSAGAAQGAVAKPIAPWAIALGNEN